MNQTPPSSQEPSAPYGGQPQQPGAPQAAEPRYVQVALPTAKPYMTYAIMAITIAVFVLQEATPYILGTAFWQGDQLDWLTFYGAQIRQLILQGQLWRLLTPVLLHASIPHIGFNMWALWVFGVDLERSFGHRRFLLLYLLGGFSGNVLSFLHSPGPSLGASTAIFGLAAAEGVFLFQNRKLFGKRFRSAMTNIVVVIFGNLLLGQVLPGIDNWGHVGGLLGGLVFAWFAGPLWEIDGMMPALHIIDKREARGVILGAALVILIFGALAYLGLQGGSIP